MRIYGPVPSRRFGLSLGIDVIPFKTCSYDCIYCQLGPADKTSIQLLNFFKIDEIIKDIDEALSDGPVPDVITLAGAGEPMLYKSSGELIKTIKKRYKIPVLLITNGSLFSNPDVTQAALNCDILAPSLDAGNEETFLSINRPHAEITFDKMIKGLQKVTHAHTGKVNLEVMLIRGINDDKKNIFELNEIIKTLKVNTIDINTPCRPPVPERGALPADLETLDFARSVFGSKSNVIGDFVKSPGNEKKQIHNYSDMDKDIREMLIRRPSAIGDIAESLSLSENDVKRSLERLMSQKIVYSKPAGGKTYFHVSGSNPELRK